MSTMNTLVARLQRGALGGLAAAMLALPAATQTSADEAARQIDTWLQLMDGGRYAESWRQLATPVRGMASAETWEATVRQARAPFTGTVAARRVERAEPMAAPVTQPRTGSGRSAASAITIPAATKARPPTRWVARQTRSLSMVHGVRMPMNQLLRMRGR